MEDVPTALGLFFQHRNPHFSPFPMCKPGTCLSCGPVPVLNLIPACTVMGLSFPSTKLKGNNKCIVENNLMLEKNFTEFAMRGLRNKPSSSAYS